MGVFAEETNTRSIMGNDSRMKFFPAARYFCRGEIENSKGLDVQRIPYPFDELRWPDLWAMRFPRHLRVNFGEPCNDEGQEFDCTKKLRAHQPLSCRALF